MDFVRLGRHLAKTVVNANNTSDGYFKSMPVSLVDAVVPGYSVVSQFINRNLGVDISIVVTFIAVCLGSFKALSWLWFTLSTNFEKYCMSQVYIDDHDDLYNILLEWMATNHIAQHARSIKAKTRVGSQFDEDVNEKKAAISAINDEGHFNYGMWQARVPPRFEPYYGSHRFWHKGRSFTFHRSQKTNPKPVMWGNDSEDELVWLSCIGFSTQPVKDLLQEIKIQSIEEKMSRTSIRHASNRNSRRGIAWSITNSRPSRPLATVILDGKQKENIIKDMNEFLHPNSPKWYATRGIPYRRGYLFDGPPGTGKTSLSFALAGIFGLDLYCFALNDGSMTESDLRDLFNALPRRCIVLLEDIDEAGIKRDDSKAKKLVGKKEGKGSAAETTNGTEKAKSRRDSLTNGERSVVKSEASGASTVEETTATSQETTWTLQDLAKAIMNVSEERKTTSTSTSRGGKPTGRRPNRDPLSPDAEENKGGISLSGLLNAIDGVATHEGRVLIMTTNHPEDLDEALVRTGRVDYKVHFDYATKGQTEELFLRMYAVDFDKQGSAGVVAELDLYDDEQGRTDGEAGRKDAVGKLEDTARAFAQKIPGGVFSPSDIQGYLLLHKKTPLGALREADAWRDEELRKKEEKKAE